jgi:threonine/homoserine/homoserine lactone efflux protein
VNVSREIAAAAPSGWRHRVDVVVGSAAAIACVVPAALLGLAVDAYVHELWWLTSSSGLLDGDPDQVVLTLGAVGVVLAVMVTTALAAVASRRRVGLSPRTTAVSAASGAAVTFLVLAAVLLWTTLVTPEVTFL